MVREAALLVPCPNPNPNLTLILTGNRYDYVRDSDVEEYLKGLLWVSETARTLTQT